jgi:YggT family protein
MSLILTPLLSTISMVLSLYSFIVIIAALLSFVNPDPHNQFVQIIHKLTEPVFSFIRKKLPFVVYSGIDFSPLVVILAINFLISLIDNILRTL